MYQQASSGMAAKEMAKSGNGIIEKRRSHLAKAEEKIKTRQNRK